MTTVRYTSLIHAPVTRVFGFHEAPDALARLTPPWERTEILEPPSSLAIGTRVVLNVRVGPFSKLWIAEHVGYDPPFEFVDRQVDGPFVSWVHRHLFEPVEEGGVECTLLTDELSYELPFGPFGRLFGGGYAREKIDRLFEYRHRVTKRACEVPAEASSNEVAPG